MNKKRVIITGAAGFIGSHLCDRFLRDNFQVIGIDNFITGDLDNLKHLESNKDFEIINHDIIKPISINGPIEYILHFASPASPIDYLKIPIQTLEVNSIGTQNILNLAKEKNSTILVASTSEIYGDPLVHPQKESYYGNVNTVGPRGVYDEAKRYLETITMAYHTFYGVETRIIRIFNTYGPRMRVNDGRVIPAFISQVLKGENLTIFGDGTQTRSFCFIDDLVNGILKLLKSKNYEPINIGNPNEISINDFAKEILKFSSKPLDINYLPLPINDPLQRKPDISQAKTLLDWEPTIDREEGIKRTFDWFKSLPSKKLNLKHRTFEEYLK